MHLAHIKVGRKDKSYHSTFSNDKFKFYEKETKDLMGKIINSTSSMKFRHLDYLSDVMKSWEDLIATKGVDCTNRITGRYTIESRKLELDVLSVGMDLFVNELNKYCKIIKVEVNYDNSVNYHVDEFVIFDEKPYNNYYDSVEEWFKCMYPHLKMFEDLKDYRYEKHSIYEIYNKHNELANKSKYFNLTQETYENTFGIKKEEPLLEKKEEVIADSESEYVEIKENHHLQKEVYKPEVTVKEDAGRATFAVAMLSMLFIGLVMLCLVVSNL